MDMYDIAVTQSARGALYDFFDVDIADVADSDAPARKGI